MRGFFSSKNQHTRSDLDVVGLDIGVYSVAIFQFIILVSDCPFLICVCIARWNFAQHRSFIESFVFEQSIGLDVESTKLYRTSLIKLWKVRRTISYSFSEHWRRQVLYARFEGIPSDDNFIFISSLNKSFKLFTQKSLQAHGNVRHKERMRAKISAKVVKTDIKRIDWSIDIWI